MTLICEMIPAHPVLADGVGLLRQVKIAGFVLRGAGCSPQAMRAMDIFLSGVRYTDVPVTGQPLPAVVFRARDDKPLLNQNYGRLVQAAPHWRCYVEQQQARFILEDAMIVIPLARGGLKAKRVAVFLSPGRTRWSPALLSQIFGCALHALLQPRGLHFLHGAGLIAPNSDTGVLIVGASGSGKSTLAGRLITSGWRYLTDDLLLIGRQPDGKKPPVVAHAFRRHFAVTEAALAQCGRAGEGRGAKVVLSSSQRKRWLDPDAMWPGRYAPQCIPQILVFPQLTDAPTSRLAALTPQETLLSLWQETPLVNYDPAITRKQVQTMTALARQSQSWRLYAGRDLLEVPDCAARLFTELARQR